MTVKCTFIISLFSFASLYHYLYVLPTVIRLNKLYHTHVICLTQCIMKQYCNMFIVIITQCKLCSNKMPMSIVIHTVVQSLH